MTEAPFRRSLRWGGRAFGGVFVVGAAGACCGALPLGLLLAAAGAAGLVAGVGVAALAVSSAVAIAVIARLRRQKAGAGDGCRAPARSPELAETARTERTV